MSERDELYNALLDVIKRQNAPVGLVRAVLSEVDHEINKAANNLSISEIADCLKKREPRE